MARIATRNPAEWERFNNLLPKETMQNVRIVAAETERTIAATMNWLLKKGLRAYLDEEGRTE
jgi:hypothetical protein